MKLIVILVCILAARYLHLGRTSARYRWFTRYTEGLHRVLTQVRWPWLQMLLIVAPVLIITLLLQLNLAHGLYYLIDFLFATFLVWYCLWPIPLQEALDATVADRRAMNDESPTEQHDDIVPAMKASEPRAISETILCNANSHIFAVLFWYVALGPLGAVLYRAVAQLTQLSSHQHSGLANIARVANIVEDVLDWIPARLTALGYVIAGDFVNGFGQWLRYANKGLSSNQDLLINTGLGAMNLPIDDENETAVPEEPRNVLRLVDRSLVAWLVIVAIFTLGAWVY